MVFNKKDGYPKWGNYMKEHGNKKTLKERLERE